VARDEIVPEELMVRNECGVEGLKKSETVSFCFPSALETGSRRTAQ
jgi:hypothetical protein